MLPRDADRRRRDDRRRARRPLPDDPRAQGARRLRLPRAAARDAAQFDPTAPPRDLAVDRQLLPWRRRDLAPDGLPRRRGAARGHERASGSTGSSSGSSTPTTSSARPAPRATSRRSTTGAPSCARTRTNVILNQFAEFGNHLVHYLATGAALERVFESLRESEPALRLRAFVVGDRLGRDARRRRLPEGAARLDGRRGRGARVPDDARERLRRAQHPGDRRQAHPADPQRDEHRRRGRRLRPRDRPRSASSSAPTAGRAHLAGRRGVPERGRRAARLARAVEHLQRARRDQDREALRPRAART